MDKEKTAIMRLQEASQMSLALYGIPLVVTISGGKDSSVCLELAKLMKIWRYKSAEK
jgi:phosphoadenosine phosphosulfate reductase